MAKTKFANFTEQAAEPEYPAPAPAPVRTGKRRAPAAVPETSSKVPFSSYVSLADAERLQRLVESSGKSRVRLLSEALALLFKQHKA